MRPYTFYLHEHGHEAPSFDFIHCSDRQEACSYARMLLSRFPEYDKIEIFDGSDWRDRVDRPEHLCAHPG